VRAHTVIALYARLDYPLSFTSRLEADRYLPVERSKNVSSFFPFVFLSLSVAFRSSPAHDFALSLDAFASNQEDTFAHCSISLPPSELQRSLRAAQLAPAGSPASFKPKSRSLSSDPASAFAFFSQRSESEESARGWEPSQSTTPGEVAMFGIFDG
jgi:hypothetical protein